MCAARDGTSLDWDPLKDLRVGKTAGSRSIRSWRAKRCLLLLEDREGTVWAGSVGIPTGRLCAIQNWPRPLLRRGRRRRRRQSPACMRTGKAISGREYRTGSGDGSRATLSSIRFQTSQAAFDLLVKTKTASLLIAWRRRITRFVDGRLEPSSLQDGLPDDFVRRLLRDRDGGLWVATLNRGLAHVHRGRTDLFAEADGLSGDSVRDLFEDREGNIWVATLSGLDRFRDFAVPTLTQKAGIDHPAGVVRAGRQGWKHLAGHCSRPRQMAQRADYAIRTSRRAAQWVGPAFSVRGSSGAHLGLDQPRVRLSARMIGSSPSAPFPADTCFRLSRIPPGDIWISQPAARADSTARRSGGADSLGRARAYRPRRGRRSPTLGEAASGLVSIRGGVAYFSGRPARRRVLGRRWPWRRPNPGPSVRLRMAHSGRRRRAASAG